MADSESEVCLNTRLLLENGRMTSVHYLNSNPTKEDIIKYIILLAERISTDASTTWENEAGLRPMWDAVAVELDPESLPFVGGRVLLDAAYDTLWDLSGFRAFKREVVEGGMSPDTSPTSEDSGMSPDTPSTSENSDSADHIDTTSQPESPSKPSWSPPRTAEGIELFNEAVIDRTYHRLPGALLLEDSVSAEDIFGCLERAIPAVIAKRVSLIEKCAASPDFDEDDTSFEYDCYVKDRDDWTAILDNDMACRCGLGRGILWCLLYRAWEKIMYASNDSDDSEEGSDCHCGVESDADHA